MTNGLYVLHSSPSVFTLSSPTLVVLLAVAVAVIVALEEEVFVAAVRRKGHCRDAQAGEARLEPVPPRKLAAVTPCLAVCC